MKANELFVSRILAEAVGRPARPLTLYKAAIRSNYCWRELVSAAGYKDARRRIKQKGFWTKALVIRCIRELKCNGHALHTKGVRWDNSSAKRDILFHLTGEAVSGDGLYKTGTKLFGSWRRCLTEAGLDPRQERFNRPKRAKNKYAHLPIRFEAGEVNGKWKSVGLLGFAPQDPEEILTSSIQVAEIESFVGRLAKDDRLIVTSILTTLLTNSAVDDLDTAIEKSTSACDFGNQREYARSLFDSLRKHLTS